MTERLRMFRLRRCRTESIFSYYDNPVAHESESKWALVRHRLPDVLALSPTYKPTNIRTQLMILIALMNKQSDQSPSLNNYDLSTSLSRFPANVIVKIGGRSRFVHLKRIPPEQVIHVDIEGLAFSIPTRQFIVAISRGYAHQTAAKYCPPAVSEMLIDLSKTKVADEGRQYKRALFKRRVGKMLFFSLFAFISGMILALIIGAGSTVLKLTSFNHTNPNQSITTTYSTQHIQHE